MRKVWSLEERLRGQNQRAKQAGMRHDLTMEQWLATLEYFDHRCAYCGGEYEVIEHYLPVYVADTTVSNCVPACLHCNNMKDRKGHDLTYYQNEHVLRFIESKGVSISFHIHEYIAIKKDHIILHCEGCGLNLDIPGLPLEKANEYINEYFVNTGYAFIS